MTLGSVLVRRALIAVVVVPLSLALPFLVYFLYFKWQLSNNDQNPVELLEIANKVGANALVHSLSENEFAWTNVLKGIESGKPAWLKLANELSTSGYAHPMEELYGALSVVLDREPELVLALPKVNLAICSMVNDHGSSAQISPTETFNRRVAIVSAVNNAELAVRKQECLKNAKYLLRH